MSQTMSKSVLLLLANRANLPMLRDHPDLRPAPELLEPGALFCLILSLVVN
jgi:hypothetical protein